MESKVKHEIIGVRFTVEEVNLIEKAAKKDRRAKSQFLAKAGLERAKQITGDR